MPADRPTRPLPPRTRPLPPRIPPATAASEAPAGVPRRELPDRPARVDRPAHSRPDARPMRTILGLSGIAALSALATALTSPSVPADASTTTVQTQVVPAPSVVHVTKYVHLKPGETAPPQANVQAAPVPTPRVVVVTTTRQSGKP